MTVHLIHGIHATEPGGRTSKLAVYLRAMGHDVEVHSYGYAWASSSLLPGLTNHQNRKRAERIAKRIREGDSIVAHSNGCAVAYLIQEPPLRRLSSVVLIQPALDETIEFYNARRVLCIYNDEDETVGLSMILPGNYWGGMGKYGPQGEGFEKWDAKNPPLGLPPYAGHNDLFAPCRIASWGVSIGSWLMEKK